MNILEEFPDSIIKKVLLKKMEGSYERYNNLITAVCRFRNDVIQELRQINELFVEYTPHDEDYHISNLFRIADILLGEEKYEKLNVIELCLLVVSMYAHDWGMAVSKSERYYIATREVLNGSDEIVLLEDEFDRFEAFMKNKEGKNIQYKSDEEIDISVWQEYIRNTHALRSGKRVNTYFNSISNSFASAVDKICVGHWLSIEEIVERNGYYKDASVLGESVNLQALAAYIRLIDLFDLAEDRTPYVLWKYVNPQNNFSRMEWEKHRALHQITCPPYGNGRIVCISGSTDSHEVYAALMDLKKLCERYFRECVDLLAHANDSRYELGISLLEWRIEARNFKPITIEFSFEKENVFKILSDEVYNCHPYVYVRELIQNSIDAISLRKSILDRKRVGGENIGQIVLEWKTISDDTIEFICRDDGVGMDEYVLRNYFSVIGKSYYTSEDFKNKGIAMSPISKFGIGILSCFSVAERIEIVTRREPYMEEGRNGLRVVIDDMQRTFRIEEIPEYKCEVGTEIKLCIKKDRLRKQLERTEQAVENYCLTDYVKNLVHFVDYPIIVCEEHIKTIFVPKKYNYEKLNRVVEAYSEYKLCDITEEYSVKDFVVVQDISDFQKVFKIREVDINKDLGIDEVEGTLFFPVLTDNSINLVNRSQCWPAREVIAETKDGDYRLRWLENIYFSRTNVLQTKGEFLTVCNKGIRLEHLNSMDVRNWSTLRSDLFPAPQILVNFPNTISTISISRFTCTKTEEMLDVIWERLNIKICNEMRELLKEKTGIEFWKLVTINILQYRMQLDKLDTEFFEKTYFPFVSKNGELIYQNIVNKEKIYYLPLNKQVLADTYFETDYFDTEGEWEYGECLISKKSNTFTDSINCKCGEIICSVVNKRYPVKKVRFLSVCNYQYPIAQEIREKGDEDYLLKKITEIITDANVRENASKDEIKEVFGRFLEEKELVEFTGPFSTYMSYGMRLFNLNNRKNQLLIIYIWLMKLIEKKDILCEEEMGRRKDQIIDLPFLSRRRRSESVDYDFSKMNKTLQEVHVWLKTFYPVLEEKEIVICKEDFIEGTIEVNGDCFKFIDIGRNMG